MQMTLYSTSPLSCPLAGNSWMTKTFSFTTFVRTAEYMSNGGMLMFKMALWASSAGRPGDGVLLTLTSRNNRLMLAL